MRNFLSKNCFGSQAPNAAPFGDIFHKIRQSYRYILNTKFSAFTFGEVLITIAVMGALFILLVPIIKGAKPDENQAMHRKATFVVNRIVNELGTDEYLYPKTDSGYNGLGNVSSVTVNGVTHSGRTKFCTLFGSRLTLMPGTELNCKVNELSATTTEGIEWYLPISNFQNGAEIIMVDVNGQDGPNVIGEDRFEYKVMPGFHIQKEIPTLKPKSESPGAKPTTGSPVNTEANDTRPVLKEYTIRCNHPSGASVIGDGGGKVPGQYVVMAIPQPGYKCSWFTQQVTIVNSDVTLPTLSCSKNLSIPGARGDGVIPVEPEDPETPEQTYCIKGNIVGDVNGCTLEGLGCDKKPGESYTVTITPTSEDCEGPWSSKTIYMTEGDYDLGNLSCSCVAKVDCYTITDKRRNEDKVNCPLTLPDANCPNKDEEDKYVGNTAYSLTITPNEGYYYAGGTDPVEHEVMLTNSNLSITDGMFGSEYVCTNLPGEININVTSTEDTASGGNKTATTKVTADKQIPDGITISVGLKAEYETCKMEDGEIKDVATTEAPVNKTIAVGGSSKTTLVKENTAGVVCGQARERSDSRLVYPEEWTVTINGETYELGQATQLTIGGVTYNINNTGLPVVDYACPCENSAKGKIQVNANLEKNEYVTAVTLAYTATEQGGSSPYISSSVKALNGQTGSDSNPAFPSTYNIEGGTPEYQGNNDMCEMEMTGPTPATVTVTSDNVSVVNFKFSCSGACMAKNSYNVTVNEKLSDGSSISGKGWSSSSGTSNLKGNSTFDISFNGIAGYEVDSITITKGDGGTENLPASQQGYSTKICEDITVDIVYKLGSIKLEIGSLSASYGSSNTTGTTPTATASGDTITIKSWQDVDVTGISVVPSDESMPWKILADEGGWGVTPKTGTGTTGLKLTVSNSHTTGGCFYAQSTANASIKSNTICFTKEGIDPCDAGNKYNIKVTETCPTCPSDANLVAAGPWWNSSILSRDGTATVNGGTQWSISYNPSSFCYNDPSYIQGTGVCGGQAAYVKSVTVNGDDVGKESYSAQVCADQDMTIEYALDEAEVKNAKLKLSASLSGFCVYYQNGWVSVDVNYTKPDGSSGKVNLKGTGGMTSSALILESFVEFPVGTTYTITNPKYHVFCNDNQTSGASDPDPNNIGIAPCSPTSGTLPDTGATITCDVGFVPANVTVNFTPEISDCHSGATLKNWTAYYTTPGGTRETVSGTGTASKTITGKAGDWYFEGKQGYLTINGTDTQYPAVTSVDSATIKQGSYDVSVVVGDSVCAVYDVNAEEVGECTENVSFIICGNNAQSATVNAGSSCTISFSDYDGVESCEFDGWYDTDTMQKVSSNTSYSFVVDDNKWFECRFKNKKNPVVKITISTELINTGNSTTLSESMAVTSMTSTGNETITGSLSGECKSTYYPGDGTGLPEQVTGISSCLSHPFSTTESTGEYLVEREEVDNTMSMEYHYQCLMYANCSINIKGQPYPCSIGSVDIDGVTYEIIYDGPPTTCR